MAQSHPVAHVDWSYSTANLYHSCPRRFFYRYQETPESTDHREGIASTTVQPPGPRIGSVVHDCIEEQIERWRENERTSLQSAQTVATEALQQYVTENKDDLRNTYVADMDQFDPDDFARSLIRTAHNHLETFFQVIWPQFDAHRYITHEQTFSFEINKHTVWVRPDLCTRNPDGDFVITDWKTSPPDRFREPSLQVLTYSLWAYHEYEPELDRILVQLVHTNRGEFERTRPDQDDINQIVDQINADRDDWTSFDSPEDFQPEPEVDKCRSCGFLSQCEAGQNILDEEIS